MKIIRMAPLESANSKTVAYFDIQTPEEIVIKGFRIVNGSNGLFISSPNDKGKDGKYYDSVILPKEMRTHLEKMAIEEFNEKK